MLGVARMSIIYIDIDSLHSGFRVSAWCQPTIYIYRLLAAFGLYRMVFRCQVVAPIPLDHSIEYYKHYPLKRLPEPWRRDLNTCLRTIL